MREGGVWYIIASPPTAPKQLTLAHVVTVLSQQSASIATSVTPRLRHTHHSSLSALQQPEISSRPSRLPFLHHYFQVFYVRPDFELKGIIKVSILFHMKHFSVLAPGYFKVAIENITRRLYS